MLYIYSYILLLFIGDLDFASASNDGPSRPEASVPRIEMLSGARALNGDHIYTLASVNANAAVIKGVLKQGKPEQLTATWRVVRIGTALFHVLRLSVRWFEKVVHLEG